MQRSTHRGERRPSGSHQISLSRSHRPVSVLSLRVFIFTAFSVLTLLYLSAAHLLRASHGSDGKDSSSGVPQNGLRSGRSLDRVGDPSESGGVEYHGVDGPGKRITEWPAPQKVELGGALVELQSLGEEERASLLKRVRAGTATLNAEPTRMHGIVGVGDDGQTRFVPKTLDPKAQTNMSAILRRGGGFNLELSDSLALDRNVADSRHQACAKVDYSQTLMHQASVVIVFYNEPFSTLMRSVHSVLNLTPPSLLKEIILVDDGSDLDWIRSRTENSLNTNPISNSHPDSNFKSRAVAESDMDKITLEEYVKVLPKTRLVRLPERKGIVAARLAGIKASTAPIFVILDSHIEVQPGWLEPLSGRITEAPNAVVMPQVDSMNARTFEYVNGGIGCTLGFLWKLIEHSYEPGESSPAERLVKDPTAMVSSPTMAGGLFAANRDFFLNGLGGGYDEGLQFWGTENLELSFRLWLCGGRLECSRCSRVYHVFRDGGVGYSSPPHSTTINKLRVLSTWMDEYADLAWHTIGSPKIDFGYDSVLETRKWRKQKQCKNFQYFFDEVWPESLVKKLPEDVPYLGTVQHLASGRCLDLANDHPESRAPVLYECHGAHSQQFMFFRNAGRIMPVANDETCVHPRGKTIWCERDASLKFTVLPANGPEGDNMERDKDGADSAADAGAAPVAPSEFDTIMLKHGENECLGVDASGKVASVACDDAARWRWQKYPAPKQFTPPSHR